MLAAGGATLRSNLGGGTNTSILNNGLIRADASGSVTASPQGAFTVGLTGVLQASGGTIFIPNATTFSNYAGTTLTGGAYKVSSGGTLNFDTTRTSITTLATGTTVELNGASTFSPINQLANNSGTFRLLGGRTFTTVGAFSNSGLLEISGSGSAFTMAAGATFTNSGAVNILSGATFNSGSAMTISSGQVTVGAASTLGGAGGLTIQNLAVARVDGTAAKNVTVAVGGRVQGNGTITGNLVADGEIAPGNSTGTLTINGSVTQSGGSITNIEIGGKTPGTQYDRIIVGQTMTLDGLLSLSLLNGFTPDSTDTFVIIQAGSVAGRWLNTPGDQYFTSNFRIDVLYAQTTVSLTGFTPIPEPCGLALVGLGAIGLFAVRRRRPSS